MGGQDLVLLCLTLTCGLLRRHHEGCLRPRLFLALSQAKCRFPVVLPNNHQLTIPPYFRLAQDHRPHSPQNIAMCQDLFPLSMAKGYHRVSPLANTNDTIYLLRTLRALLISQDRDLRTGRYQVRPYLFPPVRVTTHSRVLASRKSSYHLSCRQPRGQNSSFLRAVNARLYHLHLHPYCLCNQAGQTLVVLTTPKSWKTPAPCRRTLPSNLPLFPPGQLGVDYWIHIAICHCRRSLSHSKKPHHGGSPAF